jgi:hypothetical protein
VTRSLSGLADSLFPFNLQNLHPIYYPCPEAQQ